MRPVRTHCAHLRVTPPLITTSLLAVLALSLHHKLTGFRGDIVPFDHHGFDTPDMPHFPVAGSYSTSIPGYSKCARSPQNPTVANRWVDGGQHNGFKIRARMAPARRRRAPQCTGTTGTQRQPVNPVSFQARTFTGTASFPIIHFGAVPVRIRVGDKAHDFGQLLRSCLCTRKGHERKNGCMKDETKKELTKWILSIPL